LVTQILPRVRPYSVHLHNAVEMNAVATGWEGSIMTPDPKLQWYFRKERRCQFF